MEKLEVKSGTRTGLTEKEREISANAIQRHVETEERVSRLRAMHHSTLDEEDEEDGEYLLHGYVGVCLSLFIHERRALYFVVASF